MFVVRGFVLLKTDASVVIVYKPAGTFVITSVARLIRDRLAFNAALVWTVTFALGTAPLQRIMMKPEILPRSDCPRTFASL